MISDGFLDKELAEKLKAKWPEILRWMIDGCLEWQRDGLRPPEVVTLATEDYFLAQDLLSAWMNERCVRGPNRSSRPSALLADFNMWAETNGEARANRTRFRGLIERQEGLRYKVIHGSDYVAGIDLKPSDANTEGGQGWP